ncbi:MAG: hypothetical protein JO273_23185 [Methylobacteriaceae bacterium]|nr:hypothetical protein [Methylobacteriaceae bacterium]
MLETGSLPASWHSGGRLPPPAIADTCRPKTRKPPTGRAAARSPSARPTRRAGYDPEGVTLFSYAVVQALAEGYKRAGKLDGPAIAKALRAGGPVETVLGPVEFNRHCPAYVFPIKPALSGV